MQLRVLSYNIHKCIGGLDRKYDPKRIVAAIAAHAPDVVLLQEVDSGVKRSNGDRQVEVLAHGLGYDHFIWAPNVAVRGGGEYGNAILSRFPIAEYRNIDLTQRWKKRRSSLHAVMQLPADSGPARQLHVYNVHLGLAEYERKLQIQRLVGELAAAGNQVPAIIGGDMNDVWNSLTPLLRAVGFADCPPCSTFPAWAPMRALDRMFARGAEFTYSGRCDSAVARIASDHRPLMADLRLTVANAS